MTEPDVSETEAPPLRWANLRVLWSFVYPHRWTLLVAFVLTTLTTAAMLTTPMATKWILDGLAESKPIAAAIWLLVGLLVVGAVVGLFQAVLLGKLAEQIVLDARTSMVKRLLHAPLGVLNRRSPGELITRVTSDTVLLREAAASTALEFFGAVITIVGALVLMALLDWVLLLVMLGTLVVMAISIGLLMPPLARAQEQAQAAIGRLGGVLEGALRAIRTVKASRGEGRESERILAEARESARQRVRAVRIESLTWTLAGVGFEGAILMILSVGAWRVSQDMLPVSGLVAFLLYAFWIVEPVTQLTQTVSLLQSGLVAAARIKEIQDLPEERRPAVVPAADEAVAPAERTPASPVLSFHDVVARYGPDAGTALNGVSLGIARRGHTAVVGPSGAGKTTMFSLMLRFLHPTEGSVRLDGVPLDHYDLDEVRKRIVYVEQDTPWFPAPCGRTCSTTTRRPQRRTSGRCCVRCDWTRECGNWKRAWTPPCPTARSRAASDSASPWRGPWWASRRSCCWTRRPHNWTASPSRRSTTPSSGWPSAERWSPSRTGFPRWWRPTRSW